MSEQFGEKTEAPTPKRRKQAADDGQVLRSKDFSTAFVVLAGVGWLIFAGPSLMAACKAVMAASFSFGRADVEDFAPWRPLIEAGWKLAPSLITLFAVSIGAAILSQAVLGAPSFTPKLMAPKASRLNPASGLKRILGPQGWIELAKSLLKVVLLGAIGGWMLLRVSRSALGHVTTDLGSALGGLSATFNGVMIVMAMGLVVIAGVDLPVQIVQLLGKLRMSKQEVKDEHKESEGSPEAKGHLRARRHEILSRGARKAVAEAHVVLTNPTHFAVALRYDRGRDNVPVVVAKGRGATALAIRDIAGECIVPVLEYPQLARAIYYTSREGQEVRDDLYTAIATVLAFVFGLNAKMGGTQPAVDVPGTARFDENGISAR